MLPWVVATACPLLPDWFCSTVSIQWVKSSFFYPSYIKKKQICMDTTITRNKSSQRGTLNEHPVFYGTFLPSVLVCNRKQWMCNRITETNPKTWSKAEVYGPLIKDVGFTFTLKLCHKLKVHYVCHGLLLSSVCHPLQNSLQTDSVFVIFLTFLWFLTGLGVQKSFLHSTQTKPASSLIRTSSTSLHRAEGRIHTCNLVSRVTESLKVQAKEVWSHHKMVVSLKAHWEEKISSEIS